MTGAAILITGGAGYIGSHAVLAFRESGHDVVVVDNLSTGVRGAVPAAVPLVEGDVGDRLCVADTIMRYGIGTVVHFAGSVVVPDSVADPLEYYRNNTASSRTLIQACIECRVPRFIFSSSAAVYGAPGQIPVAEDAPTEPINPYGASKLMTEWMLRDAAAAHDLSYVALRYFNVAGADPAGRAGQSSPNATHLIKVACEAAVGKRQFVEVFGEDYDTHDGTCVRDYIHVTDLATAHVAAHRYLAGARENLTLNCGYGSGHSVRQVLCAVESAAGRELDIRSGPRRAGDPPGLVADASAIRSQLDWTPQYYDLGIIVQSALSWECQLAQDESRISS